MADFYQQLGTGVASLTFGVALSVFIFAVATGIVSGTAAWLLFAASFLLMLRFWWRYSEVFVQSAPSRSYWQFLFDFLVSFFGILAVIAVNNIAIWSLLGALAMVSSLVRCGLSWNSKIRKELKKTAAGAFAMLAIFGAVYVLAASVQHVTLAAAVFVIVLIFVVYSSRK